MDTSLLVLVVVLALSAAACTWTIRAGLLAGGTASGLWTLFEGWVGVFLMLGMTFAAAAQVLIRYVLVDQVPIAWTEELSRLLLVWSAFWGAMLVQRSDEHLVVTVFFDRMPPIVQSVARLCVDVLIVGFLAILVWYGWISAQLQLGLGIALPLPIALFGYSVPVCGAVMIVYTIMYTVRRLQGHPVARRLETED